MQEINYKNVHEYFGESSLADLAERHAEAVQHGLRRAAAECRWDALRRLAARPPAGCVVRNPRRDACRSGSASVGDLPDALAEAGSFPGLALTRGADQIHFTFWR